MDCRTVLLTAALSSMAASVAFAADLPKIHWGEFLVESDTSGKSKPLAVAIAPDDMSVSVVFDAIHADTTTNQPEALAAISGHFDISQPKTIVVTRLRLDLRGFVHTDKGGSGQLAVQVGPARKTIDWPVGQERDGDFTESMEIAIPSGRLPDPFVISAAAAAKNGETSNTIVTLDSVDFSIGR